MVSEELRTTEGSASERTRVTKVLILPKEHGSWAMLLVPWAVGCGVARRFGAGEIVFLGALLAAFLAHTQAMHRARLRLMLRPDSAALARTSRLGLGFAALAMLGTLPLVVFRARPALLLFAALALTLAVVSPCLVRARRDRALPGQFLAAVALPLAAPAAYYVARGALDAVALGLWLLNALFFLSAVLYVRLKIEARARKTAGWLPLEHLRLAGPTLALDAAILVGVAAAISVSGLPRLVALAFLPMAIQAVVGVLWLRYPARLKRVGLLATAHAIAFGALVIWLA